MNNSTDYQHRLRWILWLAIATSFFFNLGSVPLFDVDEGFFAESTREMFERNDFISPYINGKPNFDKPILIYWLQVTSVAAFGLNEFAVRLPSALAASLWVIAVFAFMRRVRDERLAYYAALVTALALSISVIAKAATADALLNLFVVLAMFAIYLFYKERHARYIVGAFAAMGLGFLTKGPIAVLIPGVVSLVFFALRGEWRAWFRAVLHPGGWLLFIVLAAPWYVLQYQKEGQAFIDGFFFHHNVGRFQGAMEQHGGSYFYYVPAVLVAMLPFSTLVLKVVSRYREIWRDDLMLFCALWFGFVFVFFSLSSTKLPHYMNYGLTGMAILVALVLPEIKSRVAALAPLLLFALVLLLLPEILAGVNTRNDAYTQAVLAAAQAQWGLYERSAAALCIVVGAWLMFTRRHAIANQLFVAGFLCCFLLSGVVLPALGEVIQRPVVEAAALARAQNLRVVMWHLDVPSFSFYAQRVTPRRKPELGEAVLTKFKYLAELPGYEVIYEKNGVVLAQFKNSSQL